MNRDLLPWAMAGIPPGGHVLEIGPGPGAATGALLSRAQELTCVEVDRAMADTLVRRYRAAANVHVHHGDAAALAFADDTFDTVVCLMVLHHVAPAERQHRLLAEAARVLRPGGTFVLLDSLPGLIMSALHIGDTMLLADPATIGYRLTRAGFDTADVDVRFRAFRARARRVQPAA